MFGKDDISYEELEDAFFGVDDETPIEESTEETAEEQQEEIEKTPTEESEEAITPPEEVQEETIINNEQEEEEESETEEVEETPEVEEENLIEKFLDNPEATINELVEAKLKKKDEEILRVRQEEDQQRKAYDIFIGQKEELKKEFASDYDQMLNDGLLKKIENTKGMGEKILASDNMALTAYYFGKFGTTTPTPKQIGTLTANNVAESRAVPPQPLRGNNGNNTPKVGYVDLDNADLDID